MFSIKLLRVILGIGQREFAQRSGVSLRELARIEAAEVIPRRDVAQKIDLAFEAFISERAERYKSAAKVKVDPKLIASMQDFTIVQDKTPFPIGADDVRSLLRALGIRPKHGAA